MSIRSGKNKKYRRDCPARKKVVSLLKKIHVAIIILVTCCIMAAAASGCGEKKVSVIASIIEIEGSALLNSKPAKVGDALSAGDALEVDGGSFAKIRYSEEKYEFCIYKTEGDQAHGKCVIKPISGDGKTFMCELVSGLLTFFVPPRENRDKRLEILSSEAIVAIHQTQGKVVSGEKEYVAALREGKISVIVKGETFEVSAGKQLYVDKKSGARPVIKDYDFMDSKENSLYSGGSKLKDIRE